MSQPLTLNAIEELLDKKLSQQKTDILADVDKRFIEQDERFDEKLTKKLNQILNKKLKPLKDDLTEIRGALNGTIRVQEREQNHLKKRVDRLDDHLNLSHLPEPPLYQIATQAHA